MLKSLTINNYAIISDLKVDWSEGLNIITGQTGSGKSIILGALQLLSGQKVDISVFLDQSKNLIVEGVFDVSGYGLETFFEENELDYSNEILIRRQISPNGKSRLFIEDIPVNHSVVKTLMGFLVDIHSQHQSLLLARSNFQLDVLDAIAGTQAMRDDVALKYQQYQACSKVVNLLQDKLINLEKEFDYLSYQVEQIDHLKISEGEIDLLEQKLYEIEHSEELIYNLSDIYKSLNDDNGLNSSLLVLSKKLDVSCKYLADLDELNERFKSVLIEIDDISSSIGNIASSINYEPGEKDRLSARLDAINSLLVKHNVSSESELLSKCEEMRRNLLSIDSDRLKLDELKKNLSQYYDDLKTSCDVLSKNRITSIGVIENYVVESLQRLGIGNAKFKIHIECIEPTITGSDKIDFLFTANEISAMQPISKVASGGEISRLMFVLKSLVARNIKLPTIIFDEIDTGISGSIADSMGDMMDEMGKSMQVINITHLPQVAAKGESHFEVYKKDSMTFVTRLTPEQRINKIAEMLSASEITDAAIQQAKLLLHY